ncbi:hypothetical protein BD413DRAFT_613782 [Trametes elegans]|nr:hypothetical protein BD413DRAFT_613782 [Trametes elegans]
MPPKKKSRISKSLRGGQTNSGNESTELRVVQYEDWDSGSDELTNADSLPACCGPIEDLPLDILLHIFALVHSWDVLALSRTSKTFRAFLMSRRSERVWRDARYANLLFGSSCTNCGEHTDEDVLWMLGSCFCLSCKRTQLVRDTAIDYLLEEVYNVRRDLLGSLKSLAGSPNQGYEIVKCQFLLLPMTTEHFSGHYIYFHRPEAKRFKKLWTACETVQQKKLLFVRHIQPWVHNESERKHAEREAIRETRKADIVAALGQLGWAKELSKMDEWQSRTFFSMEVFHVAEPLSDAAWDRMVGDLTAQLKDIRDRRFEAERLQATTHRLQMLRAVVEEHESSAGARNFESDLRAEFADIALRPLLRKLVEAPTTDVVAKDDFAKVCKGFAALQSEWLSDREREFGQLIGNVSETESRPCGDLVALAVVTFGCKDCKRAGMRWPHVLAHRCGRANPDDVSHSMGQYVQVLGRICDGKDIPYPWRRSPPFKAECLSDSAILKLVRAVGCDPSTTTHEEIENCRLRFYCTICAVPSVGYMEVYDWWTVPLHLRPRCNLALTPFGDAKPRTKWKILDKEQTSAVIRAEAKQHAAGDVPSDVFGCTRCRFRYRGLPQSHCAQAHGIGRPKVDKDFYLHPDSGGAGHAPIVVYPDDVREDRIAQKDVSNGRAIFSPWLFMSESGSQQ